jgi:hypothetical protein
MKYVTILTFQECVLHCVTFWAKCVNKLSMCKQCNFLAYILVARASEVVGEQSTLYGVCILMTTIHSGLPGRVKAH